MEAIPGEAKPATPCASSLGLAQPGISRATTGQTHSAAREEEGSAAAPQRAGGPRSVLGDGELTATYGSVREPAQGGCRERDKNQVSETQQIFIFARERKMKPPVSEHHHFHLPFNQPLPASPSTRPSQVQAVILFLSQKGARGLACWIWQFIKQIKSLA